MLTLVAIISEIATVPILDALPNPRGGAVPTAEAALRAAQQAFERRADPAEPLAVASAALHEAGWLAAQRFTVALAHAAPLAATEVQPIAFESALRDFRAALERHNLRELACSPLLFEHYGALCAQAASDLRADTPRDALALAGRAVPPATLYALSPHALAHLRARYEQALLGALRASEAATDTALDGLAECTAELAGPFPYDFWRLAGACVRVLRVHGGVELKRFLARCNLLLGEQARGLRIAPAALVREALALFWRDYALYGAAAEDVSDVELLHDYGLTVAWHVAATQASEALWEAGAARAEAEAVRAAPTRELGVVTVNGHAYEDFLQTADASMAELALDPRAADAGAAWQAAEAAYRVGSAACALGLGHTALLADALGLAWRRRAHLGATDEAGAAACRQAAEALRAALHRIAAGIAPPDLTDACAALAGALSGAARNA
ncbi:hypothetical protein WS83_10790 [Burkholderia sp. MSMB2042]|nr:hypothetical protein WS78_03415 [Burkholderia savannae]KVG46531.1 hypothetical protein WS77_05805 [Burkholderia sp. MSMB0265]KVG88942.1 hypothetical protein WS81_23710 [Burkholderia sp. MSMB2040]KVG93116.1 hypothetical protein WS83_10790 [Burkholderia sp. MSMB2042]KVH02252.1 hypothetical protein WS82_21275 [Burkholderia sp. MSMB2041]KVK74473.1 hypothetical protein WS91_18090 [Burkholderia sp. MSMB1498]